MRKMEPDERTAVELLAGHGGLLLQVLDSNEHPVGFSKNQSVAIEPATPQTPATTEAETNTEDEE